MRFFREPLNSSWLMLADRPCLWNVQVTQWPRSKPPETPGDVCDWINNLSVSPLRLLMGCPWIDCQGVCCCIFAECELTWASAAARFYIKLKSEWVQNRKVADKYICVCVCVCVCIYIQFIGLSSWTLLLESFSRIQLVLSILNLSTLVPLYMWTCSDAENLG